jgi:hypothetical protein
VDLERTPRNAYISMYAGTNRCYNERGSTTYYVHSSIPHCTIEHHSEEEMVSCINLYNNRRKSTDRKIKESGILVLFSQVFAVVEKNNRISCNPSSKRCLFVFYCSDESAQKIGHSPYVQTVSSNWDLSQHKLQCESTKQEPRGMKNNLIIGT